MYTKLILVLLVVTFAATTAEAATKSTTKTAAASSTVALTPQEVEKRVRAEFAATPAMIEIARCESEFRHYNGNGTVLRGGYNAGMVGVFQFYEAIHASQARALGFDLATLEGNLKYAKHLHSISGTQPWNSSKSCWNVPTKTSTSLSTSERAELLAKIRELTKLVVTLQKLLALKTA